MDVEEPDAEPGRRDTRLRDGMWDVVELEIQEDVGTVPENHADDLRASGEEELLPDLEDADLLGEEAHETLRLGGRVDVEREDETVSESVGPGRQVGPAAAHRGATS